MVFHPFEYALFFLNRGQAQRSMGSQWKWDEKLMGTPEPDWKNYFSWDEPGKLKTEVRETSVPLSVEYQIQPKLKFEDLILQQGEELLISVVAVCIINSINWSPDFNSWWCFFIDKSDLSVWRLCRSGIPSLMRPYVWTQLSGACRLKKVMNAQFRNLVPGNRRKEAGTVYQFLLKQVENIHRVKLIGFLICIGDVMNWIHTGDAPHLLLL